MEAIRDLRTAVCNSIEERFAWLETKIEEEFERRLEAHKQEQKLLQRQCDLGISETERVREESVHQHRKFEEKLNTSALKIEELECENARLQSKLERAAKRPRNPQPVDTPESEKTCYMKLEPSNVEMEIGRDKALTSSRKEVKDLQLKLKKAQHQCEVLTLAQKRLVEKSRQTRNAAKSLKEYHERSLKAAKIAYPDGMAVQKIPSTPSRDSVNTAARQSTTSSMRLSISDSDGARNSESNAAVSSPVIDASTQSSSPSSPNRLVTFPKTTIDSVHDDNSHDSDIVEFVSERSLKRKRSVALRPQAGGITKEPRELNGSITKPVVVKSEQGSSPPDQSSLSTSEFVHDSLDLDAIGQRIVTPTKRQLHGTAMRSHSRKTQLGHHQTFSQRRPSDEKLACRIVSNVGDDDKIALATTTAGLQRTVQDAIMGLKSDERQKPSGAETLSTSSDRNIMSKEPNSKNLETPDEPGTAQQDTDKEKVQRRQMKSARITSMGEDPDTSGNLIDVGDTSASMTNRSRLALQATPKALRPLTPNTRVPPKTGKHVMSTIKSRPPDRRDRGAHAVPILAEDGEDFISNLKALSTILAAERGLPETRPLKAAEVHGRLRDLLVNPSTEKPTLSPASRTKSSPSKTQTYSAPPSFASDMGKLVQATGAGRNTPIACGSPILSWNDKAQLGNGTPKHQIKRPSYSSRSLDQPDINLEDEPLRARPLSRLRPSDFVVNPATNQGIKFSYSEAVRNKYQRKCLPSCTSPECCGDKLRKVISIGGFLIEPSTPMPPTDTNEQDSRILEEHLGADSGRLAYMPPEEREMALMLARIKMFADKHGKHRLLHERPLSPPGFWRTDMPTAQEQQADKEQADKRERQQVEERYAEAMRPGGRWLFRDE